jgi:hypothetical protein
MYLRRVNPNRVHVGADLTVGEDGASTVSLHLCLSLMSCFRLSLIRIVYIFSGG